MTGIQDQSQLRNALVVADKLKAAIDSNQEVQQLIDQLTGILRTSQTTEVARQEMQ